MHSMDKGAIPYNSITSDLSCFIFMFSENYMKIRAIGPREGASLAPQILGSANVEKIKELRYSRTN